MGKIRTAFVGALQARELGKLLHMSEDAARLIMDRVPELASHPVNRLQGTLQQLQQTLQVRSCVLSTYRHTALCTEGPKVNGIVATVAAVAVVWCDVQCVSMPVRARRSTRRQPVLWLLNSPGTRTH